MPTYPVNKEYRILDNISEVDAFDKFKLLIDYSFKLTT